MTAQGSSATHSKVSQEKWPAQPNHNLPDIDTIGGLNVDAVSQNPPKKDNHHNAGKIYSIVQRLPSSDISTPDMPIAP